MLCAARRFRLLAAAGVVAATGVVGAAGSQLVADIPIDVINGHAYFHATINDEPVLAVFDTGASSTVVSARLVERLGLSLAPGTQAAVGAGASVAVRVLANPLALAANGFSSSVPAAAVDLGALSGRTGRQIDVIVGRAWYASHVVQIDYGASRLRLFAAGSKPAGGLAEQVPVAAGAVPTVEASVTTDDGQLISGRFFVDTGAAPTIVFSQQAAERYRLLDSTSRRLDGTAQGLNASFPASRIRLARMTVGNFTLDEPIAMISSALGGALQNAGVLGVVGAGFFDRFTFTLDLSRRQLFLEPTAAWAEPDEFIGVGMSLTAEGDDLDRVVVSQVLPALPAAEQGLTAGDRIVLVDGDDVALVGLVELRNRLGRAGRPVRLQVQRLDMVLEVSLTPRRLL